SVEVSIKEAAWLKPSNLKFRISDLRWAFVQFQNFLFLRFRIFNFSTQRGLPLARNQPIQDGRYPVVPTAVNVQTPLPQPGWLAACPASHHHFPRMVRFCPLFPR